MQDLVGQQFGNYHLTRLLGKGGFAEVYLGQHVRLKMQAAIKVLQAHLAEEDREEFQREAQTIATLVHPNIVRVLDFDVRDGTPFLVMDYAPYGTLRQKYARGTRVPLSEVVASLREIASALQYAHDQKLIHRDIKPENMLIGRRNEVVLSDFGIATVAHSTSSMMTQASVGTIPYMAPEQIQAHPRQASDQYALGVVVYEWLCGGRPFDGSYAEIFAKHIMIPPPSLRERVPTISPEVEQVVLTALAKDPKQRFGSVHAFAIALEQASQSVPTKVISFAQESTVLSSSVQPFPPTVLAAPEPLEKATQLEGNSASVKTPDQLYDVSLPAGKKGHIASLSSLSIPRQETIRWTSRGHFGKVNSLAWSPDGRLLTSASDDKMVQIWDAFTGKNIFTYQGHSGPVNVVRWSPKGTDIASGSADTTVQIWNGRHASRKVTYTEHTRSITDLAWSSDGQSLVSCSDENTVHVWDGVRGKYIVLYRGLSAPASAVAWSPDGKLIASASRDQVVQIWSATAGRKALSYHGHCNRQGAWVNSLAWSPGGEYIASGDITGIIHIWMASSGKTITMYRGHTAPISGVSWSPDEKCVASASGESTVQVWEAMTGKSMLHHRHAAPVSALSWSPDGKTIASGGDDHTVQVWQLL